MKPEKKRKQKRVAYCFPGKNYWVADRRGISKSENVRNVGDLLHSYCIVLL